MAVAFEPIRLALKQLRRFQLNSGVPTLRAVFGQFSHGNGGEMVGLVLLSDHRALTVCWHENQTITLRDDWREATALVDWVDLSRDGFWVEHIGKTLDKAQVVTDPDGEVGGLVLTIGATTPNIHLWA